MVLCPDFVSSVEIKVLPPVPFGNQLFCAERPCLLHQLSSALGIAFKDSRETYNLSSPCSSLRRKISNSYRIRVYFKSIFVPQLSCIERSTSISTANLILVTGFP